MIPTAIGLVCGVLVFAFVVKSLKAHARRRQHDVQHSLELAQRGERLKPTEGYDGAAAVRSKMRAEKHADQVRRLQAKRSEPVKVKARVLQMPARKASGR